MKAGASTVQLVITGAGAIGVSIWALLTYITPQIGAVSAAQSEDHATVYSVKQEVSDIHKEVDWLVQKQGADPYQVTRYYVATTTIHE